MSGQQQEKKVSRGVDLEKEAGRRREAAITLRQKKKDELLREKRGRVDSTGAAAAAGGMMDAAGHADPTLGLAPGPTAQGQAALLLASTPASLQELAQRIHHSDPSVVLEATVAIRKQLSREHNPPIDDVIQAGCVQRLVQLLDSHDTPTLQFESAWALTNIASGTSEQCMYVVQANACPKFITLLASQNEDVREQAVWALGNIAGDSAQCRDLVLSLGALERVLAIITNGAAPPGISILRNATWAMSNCIRSKPVPDLHKIVPALPVAVQLLAHEDEAVVIDAAWALSYASDGPNDRIDAVLQHSPIPALITLMRRELQTIITPALRTVGNIVTGTTEQTQRVIDAGALPVVHGLMGHANKSIRKECCWFVSNITAGSQEQIQAVVVSGIVPTIISALGAQEYEVRKEAAWSVANLTTGGSREQIHFVMTCECLGPLLEQLKVPDPKIVIVALEALENILRSGEGIAAERCCPNAYKEAILAGGGVDKIEELQHSASEEVYRKAVALLEEFFEGEEEDAMAATATDAAAGLAPGDPAQPADPAAQPPPAFAFGAAPAPAAGAAPSFQF